MDRAGRSFVGVGLVSAAHAQIADATQIMPAAIVWAAGFTHQLLMLSQLSGNENNAGVASV
jgi:hypothetical protein